MADFSQRDVYQLPVRVELRKRDTELNRILRDVQLRISAAEGRSGTSTVLGDQLLTGAFRLQEVTGDSARPELSAVGSIYLESNQLWGQEIDQLNDQPRRMQIIQGAEEDGTSIGKASRFNFSTGIAATLDRDNDRVDVTVTGAGVDHGLLSGLADNDHTQYVNAVSDTASLDLTLTGQSISGVVLAAGVDHGGLAGLTDDDHTQYHLTDGSRNITGDIIPTGALDLGSGSAYFALGYISTIHGAINLELIADASAVQISTGGTGVKWSFAGGGDLEPAADDTYNIGLTGQQVGEIWQTSIRSDGYILKNENTDVIDRWLLEPHPTIHSVTDDFVHSKGVTSALIGELEWYWYTNATATILHYTEVNHPGCMYISTPNAGDIGSMYANPSQYTYLSGITEYRQVWVMRGNTTSVGRLDFRFGIMDNVTYAATANGIYFYLDASAGASATNYVARTYSASSNTDTDTGVAWEIGAVGTGWKTFEIWYTAAAVKFYIDGALVATHTTNIPTTTDMMPCWSQRYQTGNGNTVIDYYS